MDTRNQGDDRQYNPNNKNKSQNTASGEDSNDNAFPGYPHYPASDDITNPASGAKKVSADLDAISRSNPNPDQRGASENSSQEENEDDDLGIVSGTEADVTKEDLLILGDKDEDMDMGDDELVKRIKPTGPQEEGLDIPGSELDDKEEQVGDEDEENNYYSLGGERHDDLEEDNQQ